jgi:glycine cleavage system protein P-like pyridoxal-binding family
MSWKNDRAEQSMRESGKKIMEEAAKRKSEEMNQVGKWTITLKGTENLTKEEIDSFMDKLVEFAKECDKNAPNIEVSIDPITEK